MSKRFTETKKWENVVFRKLSTASKLLLSWLNDYCDNAGIVSPDFALASFQIGEPVNEKHITELKPWLKEISPGTYWIQGFIAFQFGNIPPPGTAAKMAPLHMTIWNSLATHKLEYSNPNPVLRQQVKTRSTTNRRPLNDSSLMIKGVGEDNRQGDSENTPAKKKNQVYVLIQQWKRLYFPTFRTVYADKKKDWSAAKNLLKTTGLTPENIIAVAADAMRHSGPKFWACENRTQEFSDFCNSWNRINAELNGHQVPAVSKSSPHKSGVEKYGE